MIIDLDTITLQAGWHSSPDRGHCLLEVVSMFAGEPFSDRPKCVDPVLAAFGRALNDCLPDDAAREQLKRYIPLLPGTVQGTTPGIVQSPALSLKRSWMALDWLVRAWLPAWLDLSPTLDDHAARLRAPAPITDQQRVDRATPTLEKAATAVAARAAALAAARDTAWAADSATTVADYDTALAAAQRALAPAVERLQASAHDLYLAMIRKEACDGTSL